MISVRSSLPAAALLRSGLKIASGTLLVLFCLSPLRAAPQRIIVDPAASGLEAFAARELQRYVYVATGVLLPIEPSAAPRGESLHIGVHSRPAFRGGEENARWLRPGEYWIEQPAEGDRASVLIMGGDPLGTLYGAYRYAEQLGVRFYLHGDVIPDQLRGFPTEAWSEHGRPLFAVRGLQPFHDFSEGPDWWNADDYLAHLGQMAKLRMNFLGLHTYPESQVGPEPTVWIGREGEYAEDGAVQLAYPASYHTTLRSGKTWWGYDPVRTREFVAGAAALFERDDFGADVMAGHPYAEQTEESATVVFNRTAELLRAAFSHARELGILTCIGTETPLTIPAEVQARMRAAGQDPADPQVIRGVYRAMFERIQRAYPADYYWLWTPENWTWEGNHPEHFNATAADIQAALDALDELDNPMTLATCGWVLGPQHDRAALDRMLPPSAPMSAINSAVGHTPIERQFANLSDRPRWAIPWLENDGTITAPQFWTGRMRYDAVDALRLGCTGLIGIHWRTRILAPAISALAAAGWDQSWVPEGFDTSPIPPQTSSGATGGRAQQLAAAKETVGGSNRIGMPSYDLLVPSGEYTVTLGFSEVEGRRPGERVFDVKLQNNVVAAEVDPAAMAMAVGPTFRRITGVKVTEARLLLEFVPRRGEPAVAFIEVEGVTDVGQVPYRRAINCGGPKLGDFEADELGGQPRPPIDRVMPVQDFYADFARAEFGENVAPALAAIFARIDGTNMPVPNHWIDGPGDIRRNPEPWTAVAPLYAFVDELEALQDRVVGAGNRERFAYWLHQFRAMRLLAEIGCLAGALDLEVAKWPSLGSAEQRERAREHALPLRRQLSQRWATLLGEHIAGASNMGELGGIANLEQRSRVHQQVLSKHDDALATALGGPLPEDVLAIPDYSGPTRLVVTTVRTSAKAGEIVRLRVRVASAKTPRPPELRWRWLGETEYRTIAATKLDRAVFEAALPALSREHPALEYHLHYEADDDSLRWPASDRGLDQTVVLFD